MSHEQESTDKRLTGSSTGPLGPWLYTQIRSLRKLISSALLQPEEHQSRVDTDCSLWHHIYSVVSTPGIWKHVLHCRLLTFMTSYASTHCMVRCNKKKLNCSKENWNFSHRKAKSYQQLNAIPRRCHAGLLKPLSSFLASSAGGPQSQNYSAQWAVQDSFTSASQLFYVRPSVCTSVCTWIQPFMV